MTRPPPRSTLSPTRRSSDLLRRDGDLEYVNCGHVPPLLVCGGEVMRPPHGNVPVGLLSDATFESARCQLDRKSTRLNSSHSQISYAVFCLKKKKTRLLRVRLYNVGPSHRDPPAGAVARIDRTRPRPARRACGRREQPLAQARESAALNSHG